MCLDTAKQHLEYYVDGKLFNSYVNRVRRTVKFIILGTFSIDSKMYNNMIEKEERICYYT